MYYGDEELLEEILNPFCPKGEKYPKEKINPIEKRRELIQDTENDTSRTKLKLAGDKFGSRNY